MVLKQLSDFPEWVKQYPSALLSALKKVSQIRKERLFLVGGTIRDFFLDRNPLDIDITIKRCAEESARLLIKELGRGTLVPLGCRQEDAARVVWRGLIVDFTTFRSGSLTIEEELKKRDFTINSMGIDITPYLEGETIFSLIDPLSGLDDLQKSILRSCPGAFRADPLRLLRGYRFQVVLGMNLEEGTRRDIAGCASLINKISAERITAELDHIMKVDESFPVLREMADSSLLYYLFPELKEGDGVQQPGFHHLDVLEHSLESLKHIEKIIRSPEKYYPESFCYLSDYLKKDGVRGCLKWAALFHDLGKPATMAVDYKQGGRVTFHGHDQMGRSLIEQIGKRLKWCNRNVQIVSFLVAAHMHPFHLCNVMRKQDLSKRACLKLCKRAGEHMGGLFILAMADSLACHGELKPQGMENELNQLLKKVLVVYDEDIRPILAGPKLITGHDLIEKFQLSPGPLFSKIFNQLETVRVEGDVETRDEAMEWVRDYLRANQIETPDNH